MNRKRIGALGKVTLVFLLTLTCFNAFISAQDGNAAVEFNIESNVTLNEEKTGATISLDAQNVNEKYTLSEILDPNGATMDFSNLNYEVTEDGSYNFKVTYTHLENEEIKEETYEKQVKVEGIDKSDAEETPVETQQTPGLRSTITNGNVSIDIPDYDELVGWNNGDVKDMQVTVDFGDSTTANKKIKITLPEGLRFESITVKNGTSTTGADASILSVYGDSDPRATAISSMTIPKKETVASKAATYGSVEYEMINTTEKVVLEFKVSVDMSRYYGPHTIPNDITAEATKGASNNLVGGSIVTQDVAAIGNTVGAGNITYYSTTSAAGTATVLSSTGTSTEQGRVHRIDTGLLSWTTKVTNRYAKSKTYELYYPKGMEFSHIQVSEGFPGSYEIVDIDDVNGKVTMKVDGWTTRQQFWVWYTVPVGTTAGTYTVDGKDTVTYTWYDDTTSTYTRTSANYSVEVIDSSATKDKMTITQTRNIYTDTTVENAFQYGPQFIIANKQPKVTENQIAEFEIDPNWQVSRVQLPFDKSIAGNEITNIQYKTNKNDWRTYTPSSALPMNGAVAVLTKSDVGLDDDEYFIGVKANVGSFSTEYVSVSLISNTATVNTYGVFKSGVSATSADVTFRMYEEGNETDTTEQSTRKVTKATGSNRTILSGSTLTFYDMDNNVSTSVTAGNQFQTKGTILINSNTAHGMHILENPEIYIREIDGVTINTSSISLKNSDGSDVTFSISEHTNTYGEKIYKLTTQDTWIGQYKGENQESNRYAISFTSATNVNATGNFDARDFLAFGNKSTGMVAIDDTSVPTFTDIYDFDGDGDYTNKLLSVKTKSFGINENKNVLVETFLALENEEPKDPYVEGDVNTLAYFTPGTNADYIARITNNGDVPADAMDIYIPIPKEGQNFGTTFQSEDFKWDMKLTGAITVPVGFKVYYATNASEANYKTTANYTEYPSDYSDVNMVKIVATAEIPVGAEIEFRVPLNVDETFATATSGNKIGTRNIFNPSYRVESDKFIGDLTGTKAGTELVIAEVGGTVFIDNNGDGLYKTEDGDTPVSGHEVKLWKLNETTNLYEEVMDSSGTNQVSVTTDTNGVYLFDYTTGMGYGTYAVEFVEKTGSTYQYTVNNNSVGNEGINSDAIVANDIPNVGDTYRGWVLDIDATKPVAKTIGCGFLEYDPPVDLTLTVPSDTQIVKVGETITVTPTAITPDFWGSIKHTTQAYTWELVNASDSTYVTLTNTTGKTVSATGVTKTTGTQTVEVRLTIKDIYGQKKSEIVKVKVNTSTPPTLTTPVIDTYIGSVVDWLGSEVTAVDDNGDAITFVTSGTGKNVEWNNSGVPMISGTGALTTAGTYNVEYKVTDAYGNTTTQNRVVKVNGLPTISSSVQTYTLGDTTIATQVASKAVASYPKASDTVSDAPTDTAITTGITYVIKSGPSTTGFTAAGKYIVEYTVVHAGITAKCETDVLVNDDTTKVENDLAIRADNIVLTQAEAKAFTQAKAITAADVKAYEYTRTDGNITGVDTLTNIASADVSAITGVSTKGGEFRLTFTATGSTGTITKEVLVVVEGTEIQEDNGIVVKAKGFTIANTDAALLDDATSQTTGSVSSYLLKDETPVATIEASATDLTAINAVGLAGATKDLTFTATSGSKTSTITVSVVVSPTLVGPTITASNCEHYVGDNFDVLHGVTAEDATTTPITLKTEDPNKNTVVTHSIPNASDKFTIAGTYEVSIKVTDRFGNESTETKKVKVNGLPAITVPVQTYYLSDSTIATQVDAAASASYLKADDTVGTAPTVTPVTGITNIIKSGPSSDFSKVGTYVVEYKVTNIDGKTATKEVNILILDDTTKIENDLAIRADNIVLTQAEAKAFTKADAITRADVKAYEYTRTDGNITGVDTLTNITSADISAITGVSAKGGEFRLVFTATGTSGSITKEILVVVEGTEIQENDGIVVKAKGFTIANTDAALLDDTIAQTNGSVSAYLLKDETPITTIEATATDLTDINAVGLEGDTKHLTFTAEDNGKTSTITVDVVVSATLIKPVITADDCEHYVGDTFDVLHGVSAEDATNTNIPLLTTRAVTTTNITHNVPVTDGKYTTPGTYEVTYEITDRFGNTQTKTRTVKVHGLVEIEANAQEYLSDDATILSQVESAASASYLKASDGAGSTPVSVDLSSNIKVTVESGPDGTTDFSKVGIYKVTYSVTNTDGKTDSITVDILVLDNGSVTDSTGTLHISAKSFKLANVDAKTLTDNQAIQLADAQAFKVIRDAAGNTIGYEDITANISVYAHQLNDIQKADEQGGIYDLIFEVTDGDKEVHKRVDVIVLGTNTPEPESKLAITANDFTVTYKEAQVLTKAQALELANAKAVVLDTDPASVIDLTLSVNEEQLKAINSTTNKGGVFDLEITASYTNEQGELITNKVTIKVTVKPVSSASTAPGTNSNASVGTGDSTNTMYLMIMLLISAGYIVRKKIV